MIQVLIAVDHYSVSISYSPRISPKKSWEGSIGGGLLVLIVAGVIGYFTNTDTDPHMLSIPAWIGLGLVVVVSVHGATLLRVSSNAHSVSKTVEISYQDTVECSTDLTLH